MMTYDLNPGNVSKFLVSLKLVFISSYDYHDYDDLSSSSLRKAECPHLKTRHDCNGSHIRQKMLNGTTCQYLTESYIYDGSLE